MSPSERLARLSSGEDPHLIAVLPSGFAVMSETQYLRGYCLLLANPLVGQLNDLERRQRTQFLDDMSAIGDALREITGCIRINYGIYGNVDPFLHAHIWPRYPDEPAELATCPPLNFPGQYREDPSFRFDLTRDSGLMEEIRTKLQGR